MKRVLWILVAGFVVCGAVAIAYQINTGSRTTTGSGAYRGASQTASPAPSFNLK